MVYQSATENSPMLTTNSSCLSNFRLKLQPELFSKKIKLFKKTLTIYLWPIF